MVMIGDLMERHTFAMEIKEQQVGDYRKRLGMIWQELTGFLDQNQISNFSIWSCGRLVFGYCETEEKSSLWQEQQKKIQALVKKMGDSFSWISVPGKPMRLMYENIGSVRKNKELIRHRVFMTKLKSGCEEIYKARHDALMVEKNGKMEPGPDSNFTIWSAGGYIFGYDEIDTPMEKEETDEEKQASAAWERRQLEIMEWITNDVDGLTGEHHPPCVRLGWHQ